MIAASPILPKHFRTINGGKIKLSVFGKPDDFGGILQKPDLLSYISAEAEKQGARSLAVPHVQHANARIADTLSQFGRRITVSGVEVYTTCYVDGLLLPKGAAFFVASADYPTLILTHEESDTVVVCNAGRDSLVDKRRIYGSSARLHQSVVDRALQFFRGQEKGVRIDVICGIRPHQFDHPIDHPEFGESNRELIEYVYKRWGGQCFARSLKKGKLTQPESLGECLQGKLDLFALVRAQAEARNVPRNQVIFDGISTYTDGLGVNGIYWSHRRWLKDGKIGPDGSNGILVTYSNGN